MRCFSECDTGGWPQQVSRWHSRRTNQGSENTSGINSQVGNSFSVRGSSCYHQIDEIGTEEGPTVTFHHSLETRAGNRVVQHAQFDSLPLSKTQCSSCSRGLSSISILS